MTAAKWGKAPSQCAVALLGARGSDQIIELPPLARDICGAGAVASRWTNKCHLHLRTNDRQVLQAPGHQVPHRKRHVPFCALQCPQLKGTPSKPTLHDKVTSKSRLGKERRGNWVTRSPHDPAGSSSLRSRSDPCHGRSSFCWPLAAP